MAELYSRLGGWVVGGYSAPDDMIREDGRAPIPDILAQCLHGGRDHLYLCQ